MTPTQRQAMEMALEALEQGAGAMPFPVGRQAIHTLRAALAEPEPRNQCAETCERAKLCATCARGIDGAEQEQGLEPDLEDHEYEIWGQNLKADFVTVEKATAYAKEAVRAALAEPPAKLKPLTDEDIQDLLKVGNPTEDEYRLIRIGWDAAHSIKPRNTADEPRRSAASDSITELG